MPHQVYALAAMALVLVVAAWQARGRDWLANPAAGG